MSLSLLFNRGLKKIVKESMCSILIGDRGSGKSCLMALIADEFIKDGFRVFSNYPYKNCYQIPYKTIKNKYGEKVVLDKNFLYNSDLTNSLVLIDEARTVWNARAYSNWGEQDEEFFNFLRKNNTYVVLATQRYDGIDLNIRFACEYTFFIQRCRFLKNFSTVEVSRTAQVKIGDLNTRVVSRGVTRNAQKVIWDIAEVPVFYTRLYYRKPYYKNFDTNFVNSKSISPVLNSWDTLIFSAGNYPAEAPVEIVF